MKRTSTLPPPHVSGTHKRTRPLVRSVAAPEKASSFYDSVSKGFPSPLGPSKTETGINFALFSNNANSVTLCLFDANGKPMGEIPLDAKSNKTGTVWHVLVEGLPGSGVTYGYKVNGGGDWSTGCRWEPNKVLLDPYAPLVFGRKRWAKRDEFEQFQGKAGSRFLGTFDFDSAPFDWGDDYKRPSHNPKDLIVYEMAVRAFTADASSGVESNLRGTYLGVAEKAGYLADLGVTAVELLPVFEYDELEFQRFKNPRDHMVNVWGYSHINFFAPMSRFAADGGGPVAAAREFKEMVKKLHAAGVEVILDVVYNHTAEADDKDPYTISFRGIDSKTYYITDTQQYVQLLNFTGCGNTINANHPVVKQLIIDSLVRWVEEYHVDGFRFDLASSLCRGERGEPLAAPPLIRDIAKHPVLSKVKLIAEPWDLGMYQVGSFPNWDVWGEWNGVYRDDMRRFLKGDAGMKPALATRLCGSADLYHKNNRKPYHSVNFIVAHDGFSLYDMVAYNSKHNDANGEGNRDGTNDNFSWNCGEEGETGNGGVKALRMRQIRNAFVLLMLSQGTPMMVMGDELAWTHYGNNNWYGHDNKMTQLQWAQGDEEKQGLRRFVSELIKFRRSHPALGRAEFLGPNDVVWHENNWDNAESRFLAMTLKGNGGPDIYAAFNAHSFSVDVGLPPAGHGKKWCRLVDTNLPSPRDFTPGGNNGVSASYSLQGYACIVLIANNA